MGPPDHPTIPPALIADIAGGAYPAVMNILLALENRRRTGAGCSLDIAMAENLFPLMYWAIGNGEAAGQWPSNGGDLVTGGSPRYRLYATRDGRRVAAAPLEDKFWATFCDLIGLEPPLRDDAADPKRTAEQDRRGSSPLRMPTIGRDASRASIAAARSSRPWRGA